MYTDSVTNVSSAESYRGPTSTRITPPFPLPLGEKDKGRHDLDVFQLWFEKRTGFHPGQLSSWAVFTLFLHEIQRDFPEVYELLLHEVRTEIS